MQRQAPLVEQALAEARSKLVSSSPSEQQPGTSRPSSQAAPTGLETLGLPTSSAEHASEVESGSSAALRSAAPGALGQESASMAASTLDPADALQAVMGSAVLESRAALRALKDNQQPRTPQDK